MRILFLSRWFPAPPNNGSKLRVLNLLKALAGDHRVTLISFADPASDDLENREIRALCESVTTIAWKPFNPRAWRSRLAFLNPAPRSVVDSHSPEMSAGIRKALAGGKCDLLIASQVDTAAYLDDFSGVPALFEEVELGLPYERYIHASSQVSRLRNGLTWWKHRRYLGGLLRGFKACTVVSEQERSLLLRQIPGDLSVEVIPNSIDLQAYQGFEVQPVPGVLIFSGSFQYGPNYEAMRWFAEQVYPRVRAQVPDVRLRITGDHANLPLPPDENIELTGFVKDVRPLIAGAWVSLAPIFSGGGTRLKILEAMALQTPVVATSKGAEGLDVRSGENILIADSPDEYAQAVVKLITDLGLRRKISSAAFRLVRDRYDWSVVAPRFLNLVERVAKDGHR
jgi:glycosyltransferase involved in cell wall biosynthesis